MDDRTRSFIEKSTLLFIASRNAEGGMDVSPRGGQPCVVRVRTDGSLLLPDYVGNRRLDTIGNVLSNPDVALILLNRGADSYLRIAARASVSQADDDIAAFPADENRPLSVMVLTPTSIESVQTEAFRKSVFWIDPSERKPPLDVLDIYAKDIEWQTANGRKPVLRDADSENRLAEAGLRDFYGVSSPLVQTKAYDVAGPGFMGYIDKARFIVFARETAAGEIVMELAGGDPLVVDPETNQQSFLLNVGYDAHGDDDVAHSAGYALLATEPGRADNIRLNGIYREAGREANGGRRLSLRPEEIYFHCSAAFTRSRIWAEPRPTAWTGRRAFVCVDRRQESPDVVSFMFKPCDRAPVGDAAPGQYVTISLPIDEQPPIRRRCYSMSSTPDRYTLRISVRRVGNDGVSALLHDRIDVGDEVFLGPPGGKFVFDSPPLRPVVLISAGVGITPLLPMAEHLARENSGRDVWFIHAARDARHHLFRDEALRIKGDNPAIRLVTAYSQPQAEDSCDHVGRLDTRVIASLVPVADADFYICGPDAFMASLRNGLTELGASPDSVRMEAFEAKTGGPLGSIPAALANAQPRSVEFKRSEKQVTWTPESGTLLDLALSNDVDVEYSCRNGECQSCTQRIVSGGVSYISDEDPMVARGKVLLCQAVPRGDIVLDC